jgi:hypothetical protein
LGIPYLALPNYEYPPALGFESCIVGNVALAIAIDLLIPVVRIRFRPSFGETTTVSVPETAVYENDFMATREDEVWRARKFSIMQAITISQTERQLTNRYFGLGIL